MAADEMDPATLEAIRARLEEPPPLLALAGRHQGTTALTEYLARLLADRIALVDEVDRLREELGSPSPSNEAPSAPESARDRVGE
ncbi:MAG TPA: hypothetical protein VKY26_12385 [Actinomycetota bacterium]|nr:hypothetical protein [Actinomycetota bacterium]